MKLFGKGGKLNIIDIILILALVAVVTFAFIVPAFMANDDNSLTSALGAEEGADKIAFTVVCEDISEALANSVIASLESPDREVDGEMLSMTCLYNNHKLMNAEITAWEYADGDLALTIEGYSVYTNGAYAFATQELRIGKAYVVKTLGVEIEGAIYTLEKIG